VSRYCPICKNTSERFLEFGIKPRLDALCSHCKSLERHRLSWLVMEKEFTKFDTLKGKSFLHIAPEKVFSQKLSLLFKENYLTADLNDTSAKIKMDITDIQYPEESFDFIYCSHVLEHIVDDQQAMRELNRVVKKDGWAILLVPIVAKGKTEEDFSITSAKDRIKHYGHPEHVRNYGLDYLERLKNSGWLVEVIKREEFLALEERNLMGITKASGDIYLCKKKRS
jgi:SAM-dependent methyltransferase